MEKIKKKIKEREPKNKNDLKKFAIEEWNKIPLKYIKNENLGKSVLKRPRPSGQYLISF